MYVGHYPEVSKMSERHDSIPEGWHKGWVLGPGSYRVGPRGGGYGEKLSIDICGP